MSILDFVQTRTDRASTIPPHTDTHGSTYVDVNNSRQRVFGIGAAFDRDAKDRLGLLHRNMQVAMVVGHDSRRPAFVHLRFAMLQSLHGLVPADPTSILK